MFQSHSDDGEYPDDDATNVNQTIADLGDDDEHPDDDDGNDDATSADKSSYRARNDLSMDRRSSSDHGDQSAAVVEVDLDAMTSDPVATSRSINNEDVGTGNMPDGDDQSWWRRYAKRANNNKFDCSLCEYQQSPAMRLKRHIIDVHLGFKPFACKYCDFSSIETRYLKIHIRKGHPGLAFDFVRRKYPEKDCVVDSAVHRSDVGGGSTAVDRRSASQGALSTKRVEAIAIGERHRRGESGLTDTRRARVGLKSFACNYCNFSATDTRYVRMHIKKKHPGLAYGFVRRKYSERDCDVVPSSSVRHKSTAVGRRGASQGALSTERADTNRMCEMHCQSGLTDPDTPRTDTFTEIKKRCEIEQTLKVKPESPLGDPQARNAPQRIKFFKCIYCDFCSEDRLCDVRNHIFVSHLRRNRFTCVHCAFGSMTKDDVAAHCLTDHPGKDQKVNEDRDHLRSIKILETHGDVRLVGMLSNDNVPLIELPTNLPDNTPERGETRVVETSGVSRLAACDTSGGETTVPSTTSMHSRTYVRDNNNAYKCKKCDFSRERRGLVREHVAHVHLGLKRFGCPYCAKEHSLSNSIRNHVKTSHPMEKVHYINPMMQALKLVNSHITTTRGQQGVNATALSDTPKQQRRKKQGYSSGLELRKDVRTGTHVGNRSTTTPDVEPALDDTSGTYEDGKSHSSSSDQPESNILWKCTTCGIRLAVFKAMTDHVLTQHMCLQPYQCAVCDFGACSSELVHTHIQESHQHSRIDIPVVDVVAEKADCLKKKMIRVRVKKAIVPHVETVKKVIVPPAETDSCGTFDYAQLYTIGMNGMSVYRCDLCDHEVKRKYNIMIHRESHDKRLSLFGCSYCAYKVNRRYHMEKHIKKLHTGRAIKYHLIAKRGSLMRHDGTNRKTESNCEAMVPDSDGETAVNKKTPPRTSTESVATGIVARGGERVIPSSEDGVSTNDEDRPMFACLMCGKKNVLRTSVRHHILIAHLKYRPYKCSYCTHSSTCSRGIRDHITSMHAGDPCSIAYNSQKELEAIADANIVQAMNTGVMMPSESNPNYSVKLPEGRPDVVVEKSRQSSTDDANKPRESKDLPTETYICVICKTYTTASKVAMLRHIAIEIDYLPFMCPHCSFSASRQDTVRNHIKTAHPNLMVCVKINKDEAKERRAVELLETSVVARDSDMFSGGKHLHGECMKCLLRVICGDHISVLPSFYPQWFCHLRDLW